jgi:hypothetical protein
MSCNNVNVGYVANEDYFFQVAQGLVPGSSAVSIFAYTTNLGTSSAMGGQSILWELTNTSQYVYPASATTMTLVSNSTTDNTQAAVLINGLDSNYNVISEVKNLNGTSNVTTSNSYLRINNMVLTVPGTGQKTNVGTITAKVGSTVYGQINPGIGKTQASLYTVPNGYTFYLIRIDQYQGDAASGYVNFSVSSTDNNLTYPRTLVVLQTTWQLNYSVTRPLPFAYTQKTDIQWLYSVNSGTHSCASIIQGILVKN